MAMQKRRLGGNRRERGWHGGTSESLSAKGTQKHNSIRAQEHDRARPNANEGKDTASARKTSGRTRGKVKAERSRDGSGFGVDTRGGGVAGRADGRAQRRDPTNRRTVASRREGGGGCGGQTSPEQEGVRVSAGEGEERGRKTEERY